MRRLFLICIAFFSGCILSLFFVPTTQAATMTLQSNQSLLGISDEYIVNATFAIGSSNGTVYYLRGAFYQSGTNNYCGFTWNGSSYYNGPYTTNNGWQNLFPITINSSSWSGTLKARLDTSDTGCSNSGTYNFKIERFTSSGTGVFDSQNEQTLAVVIPTPTFTPTPTSTPPTNTQSPLSKSPTVTLTPTPKSSPTVTHVSLTPTTAIGSISSVLGSSVSVTVRPTLVAAISEKNSINFLALFLILLGIGILSSCGILFFYQWKKGNMLHEDTNE